MSTKINSTEHYNSMMEYLAAHPEITTCTIINACGHFYAVDEEVKSVQDRAFILLLRGYNQCEVTGTNAKFSIL